jgi:hypothetical protein
MNSKNLNFYKSLYNTNNLNNLNNLIDNLIDNMNSLLTKFINETNNLTNFNINNIPNEHFILQAMGLKSDNNDYKFLSFIDSCDNTGCKGPIVEMNETDKIKYTKYLSKLYTFGVKIIAHGHKPHCAPVPLIYKRDNSEIIFIDNDVSNGYRPSNIENVTDVPLSYITKTTTDNLYVGVGFFNSIYIKIGYEDEASKKISPSIEKFNFMLGKWEINDKNIPKLNNKRQENLNNSDKPKVNKNQKQIKHTLINYANEKKLVFGHELFNAAKTSNNK